MILPTEILLQIADEIKNIWQKEDYLVSMGIDTIYYKNKSHPVPKDFNPFPILPKRSFDGYTVKDTFILPIKNTKVKHPKSYYIELECSPYREVDDNWVWNPMWKSVNYQIELCRGVRGKKTINDILFYDKELLNRHMFRCSSYSPDCLHEPSWGPYRKDTFSV